MIDIFSIDKELYRADEDPTKVKFAKAASRGPLVKGWTGSCEKIMCVYKTVKAHYPVRRPPTPPPHPPSSPTPPPHALPTQRTFAF